MISKNGDSGVKVCVEVETLERVRERARFHRFHGAYILRLTKIPSFS